MSNTEYGLFKEEEHNMFARIGKEDLERDPEHEIGHLVMTGQMVIEEAVEPQLTQGGQ